ncbi:MAG: PIN domain-containing protein [Phycicoccus sp.]
MTAPLVALDTSVAVPLLVGSHGQHATVRGWWNGRPVALAGHALAETYSVLTRLPADLRLTPEDAARLLSARFTRPLQLGARTFRRLPLILRRVRRHRRCGVRRARRAGSGRARLSAGHPRRACAADL